MLLLNLNRSKNQDRVSKTLIHEHNAFLGAEPILMFSILCRMIGFWSRTPDHGKERASWSPPFWISKAAKLMCSPDLPFPTSSCLLRDKYWVVHTQGCRAHIAPWAHTRGQPSSVYSFLHPFLPAHSYCFHLYSLTLGLVLYFPDQFMVCLSPGPLLSTPPTISQLLTLKANLLPILPLSVKTIFQTFHRGRKLSKDSQFLL